MARACVRMPAGPSGWCSMPGAQAAVTGPSWANGQGVGPLIRRLRAQVPQGVIFVAPGCCGYCRLLARGHCAVQAWAAWGELQRRMDVRMLCGWSCVPWPAHSTQHLHRHARCRSGHRPMCQLAVPAARVDDAGQLTALQMSSIRCPLRLPACRACSFNR